MDILSHHILSQTDKQILLKGKPLELSAKEALSESAPFNQAVSAKTLNKEMLIKDILFTLNLKDTALNREAVLNLINSGLPVDKETAGKLNRILKYISFNEESVTEGEVSDNADRMLKAVFMMKNNMPPSKIKLLEQFLNNRGISKGLEALTDAAIRIEDTEVKSKILHILNQEENTEPPVLAEEKEPIALKPKNQDNILIAKENQKKTEQKTGNFKTTENKADEPKGEIISRENKEIKENQENEAVKTKLPETDLNETFGKEEKGEPMLLPKEVLKNKNPQTQSELTAPKELKKAVVNKLSVSLKEGKGEAIDRLLETVEKKLYKIEQELKGKEESFKPLLEIAGGIKENIAFMQEIKSCIYVPIPFVHHNMQREGELYVFNRKNRKKDTAFVSALLALNTANIGRVEAYIEKQEKSLTIKFMLEKESTRVMMAKSTGLLTVLLKKYGYILKGLTFTEIETPFSVISKEPREEERSLFQEMQQVVFDVKA